MKKYAILAFIVAFAATLWGQTPEMFRYQGRLVDGTNLVNASLPMSFKLYDGATDGDALLYEDSSSVLVVDGLYSTTIGDDTISGSLADALTNATVYLELTIDGQTLWPRERVVSVPYAMNASGHTHEQIINVFAYNVNIYNRTNVLDVGDCPVGSTQTVYKSNIENFGDGVLKTYSFEFSEPVFSAALDRVYSGPYEIKHNAVLPFGSRRLDVSFFPTSVGEFSATLTVHGNQTSGTNTITVIGQGVDP